MDHSKVCLILLIIATIESCCYCSRTKPRAKPSDTDAILKEFPTLINHDEPPGCSSDIYCPGRGEILHEASLQGLNYLQLKLKQPETYAIISFNLMKTTVEETAISYTEMENFINENFEDGNELEEWTPTDFEENPEFLEKILDPDYKLWAFELNQFWSSLARRVSSKVERNPNRYSLIYVPNGFIISGEASTELHYWDSYWVVQGLLLSDMHNTARGIIENLLYLLKRYGFVPGANRIYYLNERSEPPLLIKMVDNYYEKTKDEKFLRDVVTELSYELNYWINYRLVSVEFNNKEYIMARYFVDSETPRAESYREDYMNARIFSTEEEKMKFYSNIQSATESGMSFTSRWFMRNKSNAGNISDIATTDIIPVDLNAILYYNARKISEWYFKLGDDKKGSLYEVFATVLLDGINHVLWDKDEGMWFDYDNANKKRRKYFYASNLTPLWTKSYPKDWSKDELTTNVLLYLDRMGLDKYTGIPNSLNETGEKWDLPNAWAPMQSMIVEGLEALETYGASIKAFQLAKRWISTTYDGYRKNRLMHERYDATSPGETVSGDEISPKEKFVWTNAVVLQFLDRYADLMENKELSLTSRMRKDLNRIMDWFFNFWTNII